MFASLMSPAFTTFAAACSKNTTFLGIFKPWYAYLQIGGDAAGNCSIMNFNALGVHSGFLLIALAILEDLVRLALVAVGFVIYGGIMYVTSQGSPDSTKKAQQTIINALVGVVLAILAASIVAFIGGQLA
jgi:hypothetical protein